MKLKLLFSILISAGCLNAQTWYWASVASSTNQTSGTAVCKTTNGETATTGIFNAAPVSFGTFTLANAGLHDIYLLKYDASGNVVWATSAGGTGQDFTFDIDNDKYGNLYITGRFDSPVMSFGTQTLSFGGNQDGFFAKYSPTGNLVWVKHFTGSGYQCGEALSVDTLGNIYLTGVFGANPLVLGTQTLVPTGNNVNSTDMFTAKYDTNGNVLWASTVTGLTAEQPSSISVDNSGNAYITGACFSPTVTAGSITHTFIPSLVTSLSHHFLLKYNSSGVAQWLQDGGQTKNQGVTVDTDDNGGIYVTGAFNNGPIVLGTYTLQTSGSTQFSTYTGFVAKYDAAGNVLWAKRTVSNYSFGSGLTANNSGVYVGGVGMYPFTFGTYTINTTQNQAGMWLVKFDPLGNEVCATIVNNTSGDGNDLDTDNSDYVFLTGSFTYSPMVLGTYTFQPGLGNKMFIAKYSCACMVSADFTVSSSQATICTGATATITASGSNTYTWSNGATTPSISAHLLATTSYTCLATDNLGCKGQQVIKISVVNCTGLPEEKMVECRIYPNPANGIIAISFDQPIGDGFEFLLYDITGKQVYRADLHAQDIDITIDGLPDGLYSYKLLQSQILVKSGKLALR